MSQLIPLTKDSYKILVNFRLGPQSRSYPLDVEHQLLHHCGYITVAESAMVEESVFEPTLWRLTTEGELALRDFEQREHDENKANNLQRSEQKAAKRGTIVSTILSLLSILLEHCGGVISFIARIFR